MTVQIRRFTPSLLDGETLERLYVERAGVLADIFDRLERTQAGGGVSHVLVVGPRGAGKTHLVSLVRHRLRVEHPKATISWLVEDPYDVLSYRDLLAAIVDRASPSIELSGSTIDELEHAIRQSARNARPVVVIAENFDEILDQIGELDQQRFRRLIESEPCIQLLATTTLITADIADQPAPFYGFFNQVRLAPFSTEQAVEYLRRRAEVLDDDEFVAKLADPDLRDMAERRVRSIEQLAGGQPRIWALLSEGLTIERLDELVGYLIENFDDITPYYQSQLRQLAPLQRRVVLTLVRQDRPLSAKAMAEHIDAPPTTITKTLRDLHDRGWVEPVESPLLQYVDGRLTFYELTEPLLRLALELKENGRHEISTILDFVKLWFDPSEIESSPHVYAQRALAESGPDDAHTATRWMLDLPTAHTPSLRMLGTVFDAVFDLLDGDGQACFALPSAIRRALEARLAGSDDDLPEQLVALSTAALRDAGYVPTPETRDWLNRHRRLHATTSEGLALLCGWLVRNWEFDSVRVATAQLNSADPATFELRADMAWALLSAGRFEEAKELQERVLVDSVEILGHLNPNTLGARGDLASSYWLAGRVSEAIELEEQLLADRVEVLGELHIDTLTTRGNLAVSYRSAGRFEQAIELEERVLADRVEVLGELHIDTLTTRGNLASSYESAGRFEEAIELQQRVSADRADVLGGLHPDTLTSRSYLAVAYLSAGRFEDAIELNEQVLADRVDVLGGLHPDTVTTSAHLANSYWRAGKVEAAIELQEQVLAARCDVLGELHPDTTSARERLGMWRTEQG